MSLYKTMQKPKSRYNLVESINDAKAYTYVYDEAILRSNINLDINSIFRMVIIELAAPVKILKTTYKGMAIYGRNNFIYMHNYSKVSLKDNVLLSYVGGVVKINSIRVYGWGQKSMLASITQNQDENEKIDKQTEVLNTSSLKMGVYKDVYRKTKLKDDKGNIKSELIINDTVFGLYTSGYKFKIGRKRYIGNYHYHPKTKTYMTGFDHHPRSIVLKKIIRRRRP